jgi:peptidoglycan/LPS O-acetylase OafA/YrhL
VSQESSKPQLQYIDCVRGYAILMVITCHTVYEFPDVPFVLHRLGAAGWYGVQLFFLASAVTLLMSWSYDVRKNGSADIGSFYIRRFFRVAPAYYLAGLFYFFFQPPLHFSARQAITTAAFINAWSPAWLAVKPAVWYVVPGGWSISVEFSFYAIFPLFAAFVTSLRNALIFTIAAICFGLFANLGAIAILRGAYTPVQTANFLFFWFPNELSVFALGGVLFMLLRETPADSRWRSLIYRHPTLASLISIFAFCIAALSRPGHYIGAPGYAPDTIVFSVPLMLLILALSSGRGFLVNRFAAAMGKISFSAYLFHYVALRVLAILPYGFTHATRFVGAIAFAAGWLIVVALTFAVAQGSYLIIELPMIGLGKKLIRARQNLATVASGRRLCHGTPSASSARLPAEPDPSASTQKIANV